MARKLKPSSSVEDILKDMFILQLAQAGVPQVKIREILGVDIHRVSKILKHSNLKNND